MGIPLIQQVKVAKYVLGRRFKKIDRYPLVLMLEPLFQCNLACSGCGKIDYPKEILDKRVSPEEAFKAALDCGAPIVSIPGGEPLIHKEMPEIVNGLIERGKFVYLCTNALLLKKKLDNFTPSNYLTFSVHLDGLEQRHDESVCRKGVFKRTIEAIEEALVRGFRVNVNCTLFAGEDPIEVADFFDYCTQLGVEGITISPGYSYEHAPKQDVFLSKKQSKQLFRDVFTEQKRRKAKWPICHSSLYLDFLAGNQQYQCTPWSNPTYNVFGWQKPCYLLVDEGYEQSFADLMNNTDWDNYGAGKNKKCNNCMAHCGYEGTAVIDAIYHPLKALFVAIRGPKVHGDMAPELPILYKEEIEIPTRIKKVVNE